MFVILLRWSLHATKTSIIVPRTQRIHLGRAVPRELCHYLNARRSGT